MLNITEERKDTLKYGCILGAVLFIVNVIYIGIQRDKSFAEEIMPYFALLFLGYTACLLYTSCTSGKRERQRK